MQNDTKEALERLSEELLAQEASSTPEETSDSEILLSSPEDGELFAQDEPSAYTESDPEFPEEPSVFTDETLILPHVSSQEPAFDDPQSIHEPEEPMVYCNFSNGYGRDLPQKEEEQAEEEPQSALSKSDKIDIGLMLAASGLCLGIIGILIYWLAAYL